MYTTEAAELKLCQHIYESVALNEDLRLIFVTLMILILKKTPQGFSFRMGKEDFKIFLNDFFLLTEQRVKEEENLHRERNISQSDLTFLRFYMTYASVRLLMCLKKSEGTCA